MIKIFSVTIDMAGQRLDDVLAQLAGVSKGEARRIIDRGGCAVNQTMVRVASRGVKAEDQLAVGFMEQGRFQELVLPPEAIVYQDKDLLAINKPSGIASQRTPYQLKGTLEYWVAEEFVRQGIKEPVRVVHRLDRGTSGLMLFPKHRQAAAWLSELFKKGDIHKRYLALVAGEPAEQRWSADGAIGKLGSARWGIISEGRTALTDFHLLAAADGLTLVEAFPRTGRTHQIRVHLSAADFPIVGDTTYGGVASERLMLHCVGLQFAGRNGQPCSLKALPDSAFIARCGRCWDTALTS
ncbi:MAG: RluA family pseudouridine synthase [Trichlorobacter sp.]|uniref:RluA family pseudouridine synthase n=1 Tax=Trichlorobacter sp. TaxID=2911007 RepID=UPI00256A1EE0|nr:RluA family pseudouridine synthase [Trichlorobacter sp.]MDK9717932.1 RluA family pseudouridine synthase [Trichlorobacter sp.]